MPEQPQYPLPALRIAHEAAQHIDTLTQRWIAETHVFLDRGANIEVLEELYFDAHMMSVGVCFELTAALEARSRPVVFTQHLITADDLIVTTQGLLGKALDEHLVSFQQFRSLTRQYATLASAITRLLCSVDTGWHLNDGGPDGLG
ncbi:MAG: hypothetical protein AAF752_14430 [Bacteroidota bacterium]